MLCCLRYIDPFGTDAEGPAVSVLFLALGIYGRTVLLDRRADVQISFIETVPDKCMVPATIHMYVSPSLPPPYLVHS